jgi:hypothetical protein
MAGYDGAGALFALGVRLTKLDSTGAPLTGTANCYTTSSLVRIGFGQTYSEPDAIELTNGAGQTCVYYAPSAVLLGGTIEEFRFCTPDPYVLQFLSGGNVITSGGTNEIQTITITGTPTGGSFTLTLDGKTTAQIAYNATSAQVKTALAALSNIAANDITTSGGPLPGTPVTVTFQGNYAGSNVSQMTSASSLTGGTSPTVAVTTSTPGVVGATAIGYQAPQVNVAATPNGVAIEAWSNAILNNSVASSLPYQHWVIPRARLTPSEALALGAEDPTQPVFEGTCEENSEFGAGPAADIVFPTNRVYQFCRESTIPDLSAGLVAVS